MLKKKKRKMIMVRRVQQIGKETTNAKLTSIFLIMLFLLNSIFVFGWGDQPTVAEDPVVDTPAYIYTYPPANSFGAGTIKEVNWQHFKQLFLNHTAWSLEYKRYSYSDWTNGAQYLTIERTWNNSGFWKFNLILDVPVAVYSARFTFGIDINALQYVNRSGTETWFTFPANNTENYTCMFNWSDIVNIPGIVITHGKLDGKFWFRFRRDDIPAGHYEFDPTFGYSDTGGASSGIASIENTIVGMKFNITENGIAKNITILLSISGEFKIKGAIYNDAKTLLRQTEERIITSTGTSKWKTFNLTSPLILTADEYWLVAWSNLSSASGKNSILVGKTLGGNTREDSETYGANFPSTFTDTTGDDDLPNIYCSYTIPTTYLITPKNQSTGNNKQPKCRIWANDTEGTVLTVNFYENSTGSWIKRQKNSSVTSNTTVQWNYTQATTLAQKYWWKATIDDSTSNISNTYYFTTKEGATNVPPATYVIYPKNQSTVITRQPKCRFWANDTNGDALIINIYENATGSWVKRQLNSSAANTTIQWNYTKASAQSTKYWWKVTVNDGSANITRIYYFTTKANSTASTIYLITPKNQSTGNNKQPKCRIWANDTNGDSLTINFYENSTGSYVRKQTNASVTANSTVQWNHTLAVGWATKYWWKATVFDGLNNISKTYQFTTKGLIGVVSTYLISPKNQSTNVNRQPICKVWANDTSGVSLTVNWYRSTDGSAFTHAQKNSSVTSNSTVQWNYTEASAYGTTYYYRVTIDDGTTNLTRKYYFQTRTADESSHIPTTYIIQPKNASIDVMKKPMVKAWANDTAGDTLTVNFYENSTGVWIRRQTNSSVASNSTVHWNYTQAAGWNTKYWWNMTIDDGSTNATFQYYFTTKQLVGIISVHVISVKNQSTGVAVSPKCRIWTNDTSGATLTVYFYENIWGVWSYAQTNYSVPSNSTVQWIYTDAINYGYNYSWRVYVSDGVETTKTTYWFITESEQFSPTTYLITPKNTTTGLDTKPKCRIWANDTNGDALTINFYENSTGAWIKRQRNASVDSNSTVQWNDTLAVSWGVKYWWKVTIDDGTYNITNTYWFEVKDLVNTFSTSYLITPKNQSIGLNKQPKCRIWANDTNGDTLTVWFLDNTTGPYVQRQINNSIQANSTVQWNYSLATAYGTKYYWRIWIYDGTDITVNTFYFSTKVDEVQPTTYLITPKNQSTGNNKQPKCRIWANDTNGDALTINFYENSTGSWVKRQLNSSVAANSTVQWNYSQASSFSHKYYWKTTIYDGLFNITRMYYFNTKAFESIAPTTYLITPKNTTTGLNLRPKCRIWANDTEGTTLVVNFYTNYTGSWTHLQKNASVTSNTTVQLNFSQANQNSTKYWWKATIYDGANNISNVYWFTTKAAAAHPPAISVINPTNGESGVNHQPNTKVLVTDTISDYVTMNWYSSIDGYSFTHQYWAYIGINHLYGTYVYWNYSTATSDGTTYWWKVTADDGITNTSVTSYFVTKSAEISAYDSTYIYIGGDTTDKIYKIWRSNLTKKAESADYGGIIYALVQDETYVYAAGDTTQKVYQYWKSNLTKKAESADYGDSIMALEQDELYVYAAGLTTTQKIYQYWKSNMTKKAESAAYGGNIFTLAQDTAYIYAGGATTNKVYQYWKSNITKKAESTAYGGTVQSISVDNNYVYAAGKTTFRVMKYWKSNMSFKAQSSSYGGNIFAIGSDDSYIYVGGATPYKIGKYLKTDLSLSTNSSSYGSNINAMMISGGYAFIGGAQLQIDQYLTSNLSHVQTSASYGGNINAIAKEKMLLAETTTYLISPKDLSTSVNHQPNCRIWANSTLGGTLTINFYESSTGSWVRRQTNGTVANNTIQWNFTQAIQNSTTYNWKTTIDNGIVNNTYQYSFTTKLTYSIPTTYVIYPKNLATYIPKSPTVNAWTNDTAGHTLTVVFSENSTGAWVDRQTNSSVPANSTVKWIFTQANQYTKKYYWKINIDNGVVSTSYLRSFSTISYIIAPNNVHTIMNYCNYPYYYINFTYSKSNTSTDTYARGELGSYPTGLTDGPAAYNPFIDQVDGGGTKIKTASRFMYSLFYPDLTTHIWWLSIWGYNSTLGEYGTKNNILLSYTNKTTNINATSVTFNGYVTGTSTAWADIWRNAGVHINSTHAVSVNGSYSIGYKPLLAGTGYKFRMYAEDGKGNYSLGLNYSFLTKPEAPTNLRVAEISTTTINISWVKGIGSNSTLLLRKEGGIPVNMSDGTIVYHGEKNYVNLDFNSSATFYYRAWSSVNFTGYSTNYSSNSTILTASAGVYINCFNETKPWQPVGNYNVEIKSENGNQVFYETNKNNTCFINISSLLPGVTTVKITREGFRERLQYITMQLGAYYNILTFYLPSINVSTMANGVLKTYADSHSITTAATNAIIALSYPAVTVTGVEIWNTSLYISYYNSTYMSNDSTIHGFNKTIYTGGWSFIPADKYTYYSNNKTISISKTVLSSTTTIARIYYTYYDYREQRGPAQYYCRVYQTIADGYTSYDVGVSGATVKFSRMMNNTISYKTISTLLTDSNGYVSLWLFPNTLYLVNVSKTGYNLTISDYFTPEPNIYLQTPEKWFKLILTTTTTNASFVIGQAFNLSAIKYFNNSIWISFRDVRKTTTSVTFSIYDEYGFTETLLYTTTVVPIGFSTYSFWYSPINVSRLQRIKAQVTSTEDYGLNETILNYYSWDVSNATFNMTSIENRIVAVGGPFDLGYVYTFLIYLPAMGILLLVGRIEPGLGAMGCGLWIAFVSTNLAINPVLSAVAVVIIAIGVGLLILHGVWHKL